MTTEEEATREAESMTIPGLRNELLASSGYGVIEIQEADRSELEGMYIRARLGIDPFHSAYRSDSGQ